MVLLKPIEPGAVVPKPKYGHLSKIAPEFVPIQAELDVSSKVLWELPLNEFKLAWKSLPPILAEDDPVIGRDIQITHQLVPARDGTNIEIRIYKPLNPQVRAPLFLNAHGGGEIFQISDRS